ncbi:MAG: precorrin methylase [Methylobacterium sp. CG08_land_8_20_14_0_20_71_15]|nr:MAG: precorrin methylase [Methylobacterium sp. CG09_land_8_20_14_0_10_71_15]PIU12281.1 MAG: precorrin methylase [Methylobacterium sp. CG08_land_8_20_14_0_20_71_15]
MGVEEAVSAVVVAGIGFRKGTGAQEIVALVREAQAQAGLDAARLGALATAEDRAGEAPVVTAAAALGLPLSAVPDAALREADARVPTRSPRMEATRGVGSLAEAAALATCGPGGRIVLPRIASAGATCALAAPWSGEAP